MRGKIRSKVIPTSFLKNEGRGTLVGGKGRKKKGRIEELVGGQNPGPEAPPRSKKGRKRREQGKCQKSRYVRVIEGKVKEMVQSNTSFPRGRKYLSNPKGGDSN